MLASLPSYYITLLASENNIAPASSNNPISVGFPSKFCNGCSWINFYTIGFPGSFFYILDYWNYYYWISICIQTILVIPEASARRGNCILLNSSLVRYIRIQIYSQGKEYDLAVNYQASSKYDL